MSTGPGGPAPRVTITDPNAPVVPTDVLGDDTEPWRPRRWQLNAVALAVALTAAVVVPPKVVQARAQDRRAAVAAAEAVQLSLLPGRTSNGLDVAVSNDGHDAVRLVDVQVDAPGYRRVAASARIGSRGSADITLADTRTCGEDLLEAGTSGIAEVRVRTGAGRLVRRTVLIGVDTWTSLVEAAQRRCRYLPPQQAMTTSVRAVQTGGHLAFLLALHNTGRVPLVVSNVFLPDTPLAGDARRMLPLTVPAGGTGALTVQVVGSCADADGFTVAPTAALLDLDVTPLLADRPTGPSTTVEVADPGAGLQLAQETTRRCGTHRVVVAVAG